MNIKYIQESQNKAFHVFTQSHVNSHSNYENTCKVKNMDLIKS